MAVPSSPQARGPSGQTIAASLQDWSSSAWSASSYTNGNTEQEAESSSQARKRGARAAAEGRPSDPGGWRNPASIRQARATAPSPHRRAIASAAVSSR